MLVDTHCHLFFDELKKDLDGVLSRAAALGVTKFICVGTNVEDSQHSYELSLKYENIFSTAGVHPHDSEEVPEDYLNQINLAGVEELKIDVNKNKPGIQLNIDRKKAGELGVSTS